MQGLLNYLTTYSSMITYGVILLCTFMVAKNSKEKLGLVVVLVFYLASPLIRSSIPIFNGHPKDFYIFYCLYEITLILTVAAIDPVHKRIGRIFALAVVSIFFNYYIYFDFYKAGWLIGYYEHINKIFMDITIVLIVTTLTSRQTMCLSGALIFVPIGVHYLI